MTVALIGKLSFSTAEFVTENPVQNENRTYAVESDFGPCIPKSGEIGFNILQSWGIEGAFA